MDSAMAECPVDRFVTVLFCPRTSCSSTTYMLTSSPIRSSVLRYYSKYFEIILEQGSDHEHTISAPPQQYSSFKLIFNWMQQCQQAGSTVKFGVDSTAYLSFALLYQAAHTLRVRGLEERLHARLQSTEIDAWQIRELLAKVNVNDTAVQLVVEDLARRYVENESEHDERWMRRISNLVRGQNRVDFEQAFSDELDRCRQAHSYAGSTVHFAKSTGDCPYLDHTTFPCLKLEPGETGVRKVCDRYGEPKLEWVRRPMGGSNSCFVM